VKLTFVRPYENSRRRVAEHEGWRYELVYNGPQDWSAVTYGPSRRAPTFLARDLKTMAAARATCIQHASAELAA